MFKKTLGKAGVSALVLFALVTIAVAETDYVAMPVIDDIVKGKNNKNQIQDLRVKDDATFGDDVAVGGDLAVTGDATVTGEATVTEDLTVTEDVTIGDALVLTPEAILLTTNEQVIALSASGVLLNPTGGASGTTNLCTFSIVSADMVGLTCPIVNQSLATNKIGFAKTGVFKSAAVELEVDEMMWLYIAQSNKFYAVE